MNDKNQLRDVSIIYVTSVPFFLVTQLKAQVLYLAASDMRMTVLTSPGPELGQMPWSSTLVHEPVDIRRKPAPWADVRALLQLIRIFRTRRPVIVHSTTPKAGLLTAIAAWLVRVPIRLHTFTGQPWTTMSGPLYWVSRLSDRVIGLLNTRCYADSPSQRALLIEQGILRSERINVIGSGSLAGVDTQRFDPARFSLAERECLRHEIGITPQSNVLLFIGRVTHDKGIVELLGAVRALRASGFAVELLLVGPIEIGGGTESGTLEQAIRDCKGVHAIGYSDRPEQYLAIADVLCLPSYREGFGTVVIEAAAMGVPTVGTRITGLRDAVVDGETGFLVTPRDTAALEQAIQQLIENPSLREQLGNAARERCLREFDAKVINRLLLEEYASLLSKAGVKCPHV